MSILNIESLIKPISAENPAGVDLRQDISADSLYYKIKDVRTLARDIERQQAHGTVANDEQPRWDKLFDLCIDALENYTKDLEVLSWLLEALVRQHGFAGLQEGFQLTYQLIKLFWDKIYPLPEGDDLEARLAPLIGLNGDGYDGTLISPINYIFITQGSSQGPFALWQYKQALDNNKLIDKAVIEKRRAQGSVFMKEFQIAVQETSPDFYRDLQRDVNHTQAALKQLNIILEEKCGMQKAPPISQIVNALNTFEEHIRYLLQDAPFKLAPAVEKTAMIIESLSAEAMTDEQSQAEAIVPLAISSTIQNRYEALQLLGTIADFFRQTEPQSPLPFLLQRAIALGKLSFPDLLKALVNDEAARNSAYDLLGIEKHILTEAEKSI